MDHPVGDAGLSSDAPMDAVLVSCDIVGHGVDTDHGRQVARIKALNDCIRRVCAPYFTNDAVWASGGDGGHIAFTSDKHAETAIQLIRELFLWANAKTPGLDAPSVELRLTAHYGPVSIMEGADSRKEIVGDGINFCGSLLKFGTPGAVIVSSVFREYIERLQHGGGDIVRKVTFGGERVIYLKHHRANAVSYLSLEGTFSSVAPEASNTVRGLLKTALETRNYWAVIYHAKRLLQIDSLDHDAVTALHMISPTQLVIQASGQASGAPRFEAHPLFSQMNRQSMQELVLSAHLIERDDGETICMTDDTGDTMFIVLKGQIGVVLNTQTLPSGSLAGVPSPSSPFDLSFGAGKIVGELALALNRRRTATLQAIGPTAMLSINYNTLQSLLNAVPKNVRLERAFNDFLLDRVLSFVCSSCEYLAKNPASPLAGIEQPWERMVWDSEQHSVDWKDADVFFASANKFSSPGLYILAGGRLKEATQNDTINKKLDASTLPIVYANLEGAVVGHYHKFTTDVGPGSSPVKIVCIRDSALKSFGPIVYARIVEAAKQQLARQFVFDVFISYSHRDERIANIWREEMEKSGLRVYMSRPEAMRRFKSEIEFALAESLVMVPFVSERAAGPGGEAGWVQREIRYRKTLFDEAHCNILPIELTPGFAASFADGFSAVPVGGDGLDSITQVIETILAVGSGRLAPPFASKYEEKSPI